MSVLSFGRVSNGFSLLNLFSSLVGAVDLWVERFEQRRHLANLDERMLRDIGVTHGQAMREAKKQFWLS